MKAVILAGGEGVRLRPLTCNLPKPLVPICGKPVLFYILDQLKKNGCDEAVIAVHYKAAAIEGLIENGSYKGMTVSFSREESPLGTAGCVKKAAQSFGKAFKDDFIVISGDAVCDFELDKAFKFHKSRNFAATIITKQVDDPCEYGLILGDNGTVSGFCEKPSFMNCRSDIANTGIYILSPSVLTLIPDEKKWDFSGNVFPEMLNKKLPLGYYEEIGYWCDIGDLSAYKRCNRDMLQGKIKLDMPESTEISAVVATGSRVFCGNHSALSSEALIAGDTVIGDSVYIGRNSKLRNCIIMNGSYIGNDVTLNDCIICGNSKIGNGCAVYENAVVGENSKLGEGAVVSGGVRIWQDKTIPPDSFINEDIKYGGSAGIKITDNGITGETNTEITPEAAGKIGCVLPSLTEGCIAVACNGEPAAVALKNALLSGISSSGGTCFDCENITLPVLAYTGRLLNCKLLVFVNSSDKTDILIKNRGLLPLTRTQERLLESGLKRGEYLSAGWESFSRINRFTGALPLYTAFLDSITDFVTPYNLYINASGRLGAEIYLPYLKKTGKGKTPLTISLSEDGTRAEIISEEGNLSYNEMLCIAAVKAAERGAEVALPFSFPRSIDEILDFYGKKSLRYYASSMDNSDSRARRIASRQTFLTDGFALAMSVLRYLSEKKLSLSEIKDFIPISTQENRFIRITCPPQRIIKRIKASPEENEGAVLSSDGERVFIRSNRDGTGLFLYAESFTAETAAELCDKTEALIAKAMEEERN